MVAEVLITWNYHVVLLSYVLSVFGSWTTLLLIEHCCVVEGREKIVTFLASSVSMGICAIWSMHFTGMLALDVGSPVQYHVGWAFCSAAVAVIFCGIGIWSTISLTLARRRVKHAISPAATLKRLLLSGTWTGFGVALMHYMGMKSMMMDGLSMHFHPVMVGLSIIIAVGAASAAFAIFHYSRTALEQVVAAFAMGLAVCGMHYTGMAACSYSRHSISLTVEALRQMDDKTLALVTALLTCCFCFVAIGGLTVRIRDSKHLLRSLVKERTAELAEQKARADALLYSLLPRHVVKILKSGGLPPNRSFDDASVLFMDLVGFTSLCARSTPQQIVNLLNRVFQAYDHLILRYGLTKIDMIGDCLIVAAGVPVPTHSHAVQLVDFAIDALAALSLVDLRDQECDQILARIGICSGPVATGVVGLVMPHYSLFGDTVNVAARMEQASSPGKILFTGHSDHVEHLSKHFYMTKRPRFEVKGKESAALDTYWISERRADHKPLLLSALELHLEENKSLIGLRRRDSVSAPPSISFLTEISKDVKDALVFHPALGDSVA